MPRKFIRKYLPNANWLKSNKSLGVLGEYVHDPSVWHLNRRSVSGAVAIGMFMCWIPFPFQMVIAGVLAVLFRVNLAISVVLVWITNPVTIPPMFYAAYKLGSKILGQTPLPYQMEFNVEWIFQKLAEIWPPLAVGSLLFAIVSSLLGFLFVRLLWRLALVKKWQARRERRFKQVP